MDFYNHIFKSIKNVIWYTYYEKDFEARTISFHGCNIKFHSLKYPHFLLEPKCLVDEVIISNRRLFDGYITVDVKLVNYEFPATKSGNIDEFKIPIAFRICPFSECKFDIDRYTHSHKLQEESDGEEWFRTFSNTFDEDSNNMRTYDSAMEDATYYIPQVVYIPFSKKVEDNNDILVIDQTKPIQPVPLLRINTPQFPDATTTNSTSTAFDADKSKYLIPIQ